LPIARKEREKVFKVYEEARARAEQGEKFALSPEGGRNFEEKLLPFKAGPFLFAIRSGIPLVPVVIKGAREVMGKADLVPNVKRWQSEITVEYLPPISVASYTPENYKDLQSKTFDLMSSHFSPG
jgi:1-acyl-sn-glycerol-3-phosphate acyltransferase